MTARGLLDTSVWIAAESGRPLDAARLPEELAISAITLAELEAGVLAAKDIAARAQRLSSLQAASEVELLPIDAAAARAWARLRVELAAVGRRINVNDLWIAATALSRDLPVVTQDEDLSVLHGLSGLTVIRV